MWWLHRKVAACALLIAYVILFMSSVSVLTEARISKFEAIQGAKLLKFESPWTSFTPIDRKYGMPRKFLNMHGIEYLNFFFWHAYCIHDMLMFELLIFDRKPSPSATESEADWLFSKSPIGKSFTASTWVGVSRASWVTIFLQNIYLLI
jgi:hypothetical protein